MLRPQREITVSARLIAPRQSLASCVRAYVTRNLVGWPPLPPAQRLNRFPATVHCAIVWFIEGSAQIVEPAAERAALGPSRAIFGGPQTRPFTSYNPGSVHTFMVLFFPGALHALAGIDVSRHVDRIVALDEVLDGAWLDLSRDVLAASDDAERVALIERFLAPRWHAARASGMAKGGAVSGWANAFATYAAASGWGRSARTLERRIKAWAGQPLRSLRRLSRVEQSVVEARVAGEIGPVPWAQVAASGGFADQAHLCRAVREVTGHSPAELARKTHTDESYWVYRIWS